jgi:nicotinamidase-related amidase
VQKCFSSAFMKTNLDDLLKSRGIDRLYVSGLATFGCVNQTVLCALCRGYDVTVISDAHGARPIEGPVTEMIGHFNRTWQPAGAALSTTAAVQRDFST